ncbi:MAG: DUF3592 domain-containing protein [Anaerolineae bacterium]|nr:DUF3592 domain-containing protein [Anaerolineae bacterium]
MSKIAPYQLNLPPREISWLLRGQLLFDGFANQFGWFWLSITMVFFWIFGAMTSLNGIYFLLGATETAPGIVTEIEQTGASENDTPVYATHYAFRVERLEMDLLGHSYTTGQRFSPNQAVTVEYLRDNPDLSRIQGTRLGAFSPWVFCVVGLFPAIGLAFVGFGFLSGLRASRLLRHGKIAQGRLIEKSPTNTRINNQTVYKLTFAFTADDGRQYQAVARSHQPGNLEDEDQEQLLYDPHRPTRAVLLDNLPGAPSIDDSGYIFTDPGRCWRSLLLPTIALFINGLAFIFVIGL